MKEMLLNHYNCVLVCHIQNQSISRDHFSHHHFPNTLCLVLDIYASEIDNKNEKMSQTKAIYFNNFLEKILLR